MFDWYSLPVSIPFVVVVVELQILLTHPLFIFILTIIQWGQGIGVVRDDGYV